MLQAFDRAEQCLDLLREGAWQAGGDPHQLEFVSLRAVPDILSDCGYNARFVSLLVRAAADKSEGELEQMVQAQDCSGFTPLHLAVRCGDRSVTDALIEAGAKHDIADFSGMPPCACHVALTALGRNHRGTIGAECKLTHTNNAAIKMLFCGACPTCTHTGHTCTHISTASRTFGLRRVGH